MPKKAQHRMHAHINPFNPLSIAFPLNTNFVDWSTHYPALYGLPTTKIIVNTKKYPEVSEYKVKSNL